MVIDNLSKLSSIANIHGRFLLCSKIDKELILKYLKI